MPNLNKIQLIGHLGADPELRYTPEGKAVTNARVAVSRSWKDESKEGGWAEETQWFAVTIWDQRGERVAETCRKGNLVYVEGRVKLRQYTTSDGRPGASLDVTANLFLNLTKRERDEDQIGAFGPTDDQLVAATGGGTVTSGGPAVDIDDIPF